MEDKIMTLTIEPRSALDYIGNYETQKYGIPGSLYYYLINDTMMSGEVNVWKTLVPPTDAVMSVTWTPYMSLNDFQTRTVPYDVKRFPIKGITDQDDVTLGLMDTPLKRIEQQVTQKKVVGAFLCYRPSKSIGGARSWRNESKLYNFPFSYGMLYDGLMDPIEFKYHLCKGSEGNKQYVMVNTPLTNTGAYSVFIEKYKNDEFGLVEGYVNTKSATLPTVSSAYTDFMSSNKASMAAQRTGSIIAGLVGVGVGVGAAVATGGTSLAMTGAIVSGTAGIVASTFNSINGSLAKERDLAQSPGVLQSAGSDALFQLQRTREDRNLNLYRMRLTDEQMAKIGDYFAMFGYAQNKVMRPNVRDRYYYNYIKTSGVNITNKDGVGIPKEHFNKLKAIYDNGTTIWHISRSGVNVGDYSMDNYEV